MEDMKLPPSANSSPVNTRAICLMLESPRTTWACPRKPNRSGRITNNAHLIIMLKDIADLHLNLRIFNKHKQHSMSTQPVNKPLFTDISVDGEIDLSEYIINSGTTEDGARFVDYCIPYDVLPLDKINSEAFDRYLGSIKMHPSVVSKDSLGLFDLEKPADCYFMTLFEQ